MTDLIEKVARAVWQQRRAYWRGEEPDVFPLEPFDTDWGGKPIAYANGLDEEMRVAIQTVLKEIMNPGSVVGTAMHISAFTDGLEAWTEPSQRPTEFGFEPHILLHVMVGSFAKANGIQIGEDDG